MTHNAATLHKMYRAAGFTALESHWTANGARAVVISPFDNERYEVVIRHMPRPEVEEPSENPFAG
jgi:hypothetical protein